MKPDHLAGFVEDLDLDVLVLLELVEQIGRWQLEEVDLAGLQSGERGLLVGHIVPNDAVELRDLAAREPRGRLGARHIVRVAVIHIGCPHLGLVLIEDEGTRADMLGDLLHRIGLGILLAHDEKDGRSRLGEGVEHQRVALAERDDEGLVVLDARILDAQEHMLAGAVAHRPAAQGGDAVGGRHRRAVMKFQPVAQLEGPAQLIVRAGEALDHLRLRPVIRVEGEQRVVDQCAVIGGDVRRGPDRVEGSQVALHHGFQGLGRRGRALGAADGEAPRPAPPWRRSPRTKLPACRCHVDPPAWRSLARLTHGGDRERQRRIRN